MCVCIYTVSCVLMQIKLFFNISVIVVSFLGQCSNLVLLPLSPGMMSQDDVTLEGLLYGSVHGNNSDGAETEAQVTSHVGEENASANHIRVSQVPSFLNRFCLTVSLMC